MPKAFVMGLSDYERSADILRALGHPVRLRIVQLLINKGSLNVSELQRLLDMRQSTVSQHLIKLKMDKIVSYERKGTEIYYKVEDEKVIELMGFIK
ncbi:ArsR/SmtB family transcription factor [Bacillus sp. Fil]|uniref:ArsR/SmtB family transcription factor n=1 Tax=Bacillus sp. Fil TaxID=3459567 RepID=UPI00403AA136